MSNINNVALSDIWPFMQEQIEAGKTVRFGPKGTSMLPMLRQGIDEVVLKKAPDKLKKYDLPFYRRTDGQFVLHRVVAVKPDGYVMCGDNQHDWEEGITQKNILAIAEGFFRDGEYISCENVKYKKYCIKQVRKQSFKRFVLRLKRAPRRIFRYIFPKK